MRKKDKVGGIVTPDIKLHYKATAITTAWCWRKNRHTGQRNRTWSPEINPHLHGQLLFDKVMKSTQRSKGSLFNKWCMQKNEAGPPTYSIHKNTLTMDKRLKIEVMKP